MIKLRVYGTPIPQGSTKAFAVRKGGVPTGKAVVTHGNERTMPWRKAIVDEYRGLGPAGEAFGAAPVSVSLTFILSRPRDHYGKGSQAERVRPSAPARPTGVRNDLDKLVRAVLDALTDAGAWRDDAQVVELAARKAYAADGEAPGAVIEIGAAGD